MRALFVAAFALLGMSLLGPIWADRASASPEGAPFSSAKHSIGRYITPVYCRRYCKYYGRCYDGYHYYRCCKSYGCSGGGGGGGGGY